MCNDESLFKAFFDGSGERRQLLFSIEQIINSEAAFRHWLRIAGRFTL